MSLPEHRTPPPADPDPFDFAVSDGVAPIRRSAARVIASQARRGSLLLFLVGLLQLVFMVLFTASLIAAIVELNRLAELVGQAPGLHPLVYVSYALGLFSTGLFLALGFWARRDPVLAPTIGLAVYLGIHAFDLVLFFGFGLSLMLSGPWFWFLRGFIVVLFIDAIRAGLAYSRIVNKLIMEMGEGVATAAEAALPEPAAPVEQVQPLDPDARDGTSAIQSRRPN